MEINAKLDVDVVALQAEDEVTCLLTLTAPTPPQTADRPGETLIVVVDRSGSMQGEPLQSVRTALHSLADRLKPQDTFGVVTFDNEAVVQVPARTMADHHLPTVHSLIEAIHAGGTTDLSAGYLLGLSEARRHLSDTGASVILLSDGHANQGITDPVQLGGVASQARGETITTTTIGIGTGYDESLLAETTEAKRQATEALGIDDSAMAATLLDEQGARLQDIIVRMELNTPDDVALRDRLMEEATQLYKLAQGAREREAHMSRKSLMEDVNMEISGKSTYERRQRSRGKRDF